MFRYLSLTSGPAGATPHRRPLLVRLAPGQPPWTPGAWTRSGPAFAGRVQTLRQPLGAVTDILATPSGTYPGSSRYVGGVLLPDGRVFCVPHGTASARIYGAANYCLPSARTLSAYDNKF